MTPPKSKTTTGKTNPIKKRDVWSIGNSEKFICFDWCDNGEDGTVTVHSTVCSDSGAEVEFLKATVPAGHAELEARAQVAKAWEWMADKKNMVSKMTVNERKESEKNGEAFIKDISGEHLD
jgi:hypothetical protein